jgi:hypothetical protein
MFVVMLDGHLQARRTAPPRCVLATGNAHT